MEAPHRPRHVRRRPPRRERLPAVATALVGLTLVVGGAVISIRTPAPDTDAIRAAAADAADAPDGAADDGATPGSPEAIVASAADQVEDAGTFSYEGTSRVEGTDPQDDQPFVVDWTLSGEVRVGQTWHEISDEPDGSRLEMVARRGEVWLRRTAFPDQIESRPWQQVEAGTVGIAVHRLVRWLDLADEHRQGGEDPDGNRVVHAAVRAGLLGDLGEGDAQLTLTVDEAGRPISLDIDMAQFGIDLTASYEFDHYGDSVDVEMPDPAQVDATPSIDEEDITALGGPLLVGLGGVPAGWTLVNAAVTPDAEGECASVDLDYTDVDDPVGSYLWLSVVSPACVVDPPGAQPFDVEGYDATGVVTDGIAEGILHASDGASVVFETDLGLADLARVLATLGPLDLRATPAPIEGLPSVPA